MRIIVSAFFVAFILIPEAFSKSENYKIEWSSPITFHAIIIADTEDVEIGDAARISQEKVRTFLREVTDQLYVTYNEISISGNDLIETDLVDRVSKLNVSPLDTVFLFYFGHGTKDADVLQFPKIAGKSEINLSQVIDIIFEKEPRLFIALADACNTEINNQDFEIPIITDIAVPDINPYDTPEMANSYSRLFIEATGSAILSSASRGLPAYYDSNEGGLYTNLILKSFREAARHYRARWHSFHGLFEPSIKYSDFTGSKTIEQRPVFIVNVVDHVSPLAFFSWTPEKETKCSDILGGAELDTREFRDCFIRFFGIRSPNIINQMADLPSLPIPYLSKNVIDNFFLTINPEKSPYELVGMAQRYYHGDGAAEKSYSKAVQLVELAHEKGNVEAAGILGDMERYEFEVSNDINTLISALKWYLTGYEQGDIRSGIEWAKFNAWYGQNPVEVKKSIPILLKYKDKDEKILSFLADLCERGFEGTCF